MSLFIGRILVALAAIAATPVNAQFTSQREYTEAQSVIMTDLMVLAAQTQEGRAALKERGEHYQQVLIRGAEEWDGDGEMPFHVAFGMDLLASWNLCVSEANFVLVRDGLPIIGTPRLPLEGVSLGDFQFRMSPSDRSRNELREQIRSWLGLSLPDEPPTTYEVTPMEAVGKGEIVTVDRDYVSLWPNPATSGDPLRTLSVGWKAMVVKKQDQWCRIEHESKEDGWVLCMFLARFDSVR